jgi:hypothetical protein
MYVDNDLLGEFMSFGIEKDEMLCLALSKEGHVYRIMRNNAGKWEIGDKAVGKVPGISFKSLAVIKGKILMVYDTINSTGNFGLQNLGNIWETTYVGGVMNIDNRPTVPPLVDIAACGYKKKVHIFATTPEGEIRIMIYSIVIVKSEIPNGTKETHTPTLTLSPNILRHPGGEKFVRISVCNFKDQVHIVVVTQSGKIMHTIYEKQDYFGDIETATGEAGTFVDVSCIGKNNELHVVATNTQGDLLHTIRKTNGQWQKPFGSIKGQSGNAGSFVSVSIC